VSDATSQPVAVADIFQDLTWETTGMSLGFTHEDTFAPVVVPRDGVFQISASIPMMSTDVADTGTACVAVNGDNVACQSVGLGDHGDVVIRVIPLTTIVQLTHGDVITLRFKGTSTSVLIFGESDFQSVMTIANVD
jgi:hypothetical protein